MVSVESVEKVIFEEKKEKAENYNLYIKNELQKESYCENDDLGTYSTDSLCLLKVVAACAWGAQYRTCSPVFRQ